MIIKILTALHRIRSPLLYKTISLSLIFEDEGPLSATTISPRPRAGTQVPCHQDRKAASKKMKHYISETK